MRLAGVVLARFFAYVETVDLNPRGRAHFPDIVNVLVAKYGFVKFPQKLEDYDEAKGVTFQGGRTPNFSIPQIQVFDHAMYVDTSSSTADSENLFHEVLVWLSETLGIVYKPEMVKRKTYVSQITFYSELIMERAFHPAVLKVGQKLTRRVPEFYGQTLQYQPSALAISYDPLTIKAGPAQFSIERRADTLFTENKFFSTAPLPTDEHVALIEELEREVQ